MPCADCAVAIMSQLPCFQVCADLVTVQVSELTQAHPLWWMVVWIRIILSGNIPVFPAFWIALAFLSSRIFSQRHFSNKVPDYLILTLLTGLLKIGRCNPSSEGLLLHSFCYVAGTIRLSKFNEQQRFFPFCLESINNLKKCAETYFESFSLSPRV